MTEGEELTPPEMALGKEIIKVSQNTLTKQSTASIPPRTRMTQGCWPLSAGKELAFICQG